MPMTVGQLIHEVSALPPLERTNLIERLVIEFGQSNPQRIHQPPQPLVYSLPEERFGSHPDFVDEEPPK